MTHRLFFALRPPAELRDALLDLMTGIANARWQDDDQLHLTLRYIGEIDAHRADDLAEAASRVTFEPFELKLSGCGFFERKTRPTAVWAGVEPSEPLLRLRNRLERLCVSCGLAPETRKFTPHLTLARLNTSSGPVAPFLARHTALSLGPWPVDAYMLYESHLRIQGSQYEPVVTYAAKAA